MPASGARSRSRPSKDLSVELSRLKLAHGGDACHVCKAILKRNPVEKIVICDVCKQTPKDGFTYACKKCDLDRCTLCACFPQRCADVIEAGCECWIMEGP